MFADQTIEPALQTTRQLEIGTVDREDERVVHDRSIKPVGYDEFDAAWSAMTVGAFGPFVDPRKTMHPAFGGLTQRGCDRC